jgi:DNA-binding MarR family transcriptional regulator
MKVRSTLLTARRPMSAKAVARVAGLSVDTARRQLARMESTGLVIKVRMPGDRRRVLWSAVPLSTTNRLVVSAVEMSLKIADDA